ncbi:hypothetical protein LCGC14_2366390 [marine sediment metagenome]|uniref:Uncharacterized protein n=1 Tax=marine sediment metagenome TaxID=412755 RepID=A0A0F9EZW2_9ZZZZ
MAQMNWDQMREEAEKTGGFSPHPIGTFRFKVIEASLKKGTKGNGQILARLENQDAGPNNGKTVLNNMSPLKNDGTPNGMFFQQLGALGFTKDHEIYAQLSNMDEAQGLAYLATNILGKEVICEITHRDYNGIRDNVKSMKPVGAAPATGGVPTAPPASVPAAPPAAPLPVEAAPVAPVAPVAPAPVPAVVPVAPAPVAVEESAPVPAVEATQAPTTEEAVVAQQLAAPPVVPIPTPPNRPF